MRIVWPTLLGGVGIGVLMTALSCSPPAPDTAAAVREAPQAEPTAPDPPPFIRTLYPDGKARVVLVHRDAAALPLDSLRATIERRWLPGFLRQWVTLEVVTATVEGTSSADEGAADTVVVATPEAPVDFSVLGHDLPVSWEGAGFRFLDTVYDAPDDVLVLGHRPRQRGARGVYLLLANDPAGLSAYLPVVRSSGYHLFRDGKRMVTGAWKEEASRWAIDPQGHRDLSRERGAVRETPHFRFYVHNQGLAASVFDTFAQEAEQRYERLAAFLGTEGVEVPPVTYYLYERFEDKATFFGDFFSSYRSILPDVRHVHYEQHEVHRAVGAELDADDWPRDVALLLRATVGKPSSVFLETGLGMHFSENWQGRGAVYWAARIYEAGLMPPLAELLDDDRERFLSPFLVDALAGSLVEYLVTQWGDERLLAQYARWTLTEREQQRVEQGWHAYLQAQAAAYAETVAADRDAFPEPAAFQKGFTYAPSSGRNGYLTRSSDASLARLHGLGVDAVALIPYASTPRDQPGVLRPERRVNGEHDGAVVHAILDAKRHGMTVLLKPQLDTNGWAGDIAMTSEADWERFFSNYERWMGHYALMAQLYGVEVLCVGTELVQTTAAHEDRWIALVDKLRALYSGKLVYAANWGDEFESLTFWDHFDYIGLDNYYPLSEKDEPTNEELLHAAEAVTRKIEAIAERFGKPVLITEIGFPGDVAPWKVPYQRSGPPDVAGHAQARAYDIWFQALHGKPWLAGMYWWKWFSYDPEENRSTDYVPQRKATEPVIRRWYGTTW